MTVPLPEKFYVKVVAYKPDEGKPFRVELRIPGMRELEEETDCSWYRFDGTFDKGIRFRLLREGEKRRSKKAYVIQQGGFLRGSRRNEKRFQFEPSKVSNVPVTFATAERMGSIRWDADSEYGYAYLSLVDLSKLQLRTTGSHVDELPSARKKRREDEQILSNIYHEDEDDDDERKEKVKKIKKPKQKYKKQLTADDMSVNVMEQLKALVDEINYLINEYDLGKNVQITGRGKIVITIYRSTKFVIGDEWDE